MLTVYRRMFEERMNLRRLAILGFCALLASCASTSMTRVDQDNQRRTALLAAATAGDAEAQFQLGNSFCCGEGFYSTRDAILWWCRAARQGHAAARLALIERSENGSDQCSDDANN